MKGILCLLNVSCTLLNDRWAREGKWFPVHFLWLLHDSFRSCPPALLFHVLKTRLKVKLNWDSINLYSFFFFLNKRFVYFFKKANDREEERSVIPPWFHSPQQLTWARVTTGVSDSILVCHKSSTSPSPWAIVHCCPRCLSRELNQNHSLMRMPLQAGA